MLRFEKCYYSLAQCVVFVLSALLPPFRHLGSRKYVPRNGGQKSRVSLFLTEKTVWRHLSNSIEMTSSDKEGRSVLIKCSDALSDHPLQGRSNAVAAAHCKKGMRFLFQNDHFRQEKMKCFPRGGSSAVRICVQCSCWELSFRTVLGLAESGAGGRSLCCCETLLPSARDDKGSFPATAVCGH